jgi:hypothetical protein
MKHFNFFQKDEGAFERIFDEAERLEAELERQRATALFLNVPRNRNEISDELFADISKAQRVQLIEKMWEDGLITHTIVSQDDNGFTLRTEINL